MANVFILLRDDKKSQEIHRKRQFPLDHEIRSSSNNSGKKLTMILDLNSKGLVFDRPLVEGEEFEDFDEKFQLLKPMELKNSLNVTKNDFLNVLSQMVPCVGCRRSVERLYSTVMINNYSTLDPIKIRNGILTVCEKHLQSSQQMCTLLYDHDAQLNDLLESQPRNKKNSRCNLHSLESFRSRPFSETWFETWECMEQNCKKKLVVVEASELHATLDEYLKKHKFCQECRTKVEKAYTLLMSEANPTKEKGYVTAIYNGIERCLKNKHIHLPIKDHYIDDLIKRAEPEIIGSHSRHRERHAKTMEIAQEEVLTCIGMCIYNRLKKIHQCVKEEENACQILAAVAVHALSRSFDVAVENKRGVNLDEMFNELSREERLREEKLKNKKTKKRKKRSEKKQKDDDDDTFNCEPEPVPEKCDCNDDDDDDHSEDEDIHSDNDEDKIVLCDGTVIDVGLGPNENSKPTTPMKSRMSVSREQSNDRSRSTSVEHLEVKVDEVSITSCQSCHDSDGICAQQSIDAGYLSETHHEGLQSNNASSRTSSIVSSPEGSEVACTDACCKGHDNHPHGEPLLTLEQMLDEEHSDEGDCIPDEEIMEIKSRANVIKEKRKELREKLLRNFKEMCARKCHLKVNK